MIGRIVVAAAVGVAAVGALAFHAIGGDVQIVGGMLDLDGQVVPVGGARGCVPSKKVVPVTEEI